MRRGAGRTGRRVALLGAVLVAALLAAVLPSGIRSALERPAPAPVSAAGTPGPEWFLMSSVVHAHLAVDRRNYAARTRADGPLLLFLPATNQQPRDYSRFLGLATRAGYHVLGLDYWNLGHSVASTCARDPRCYGEVQRNRFDGSRPFDKSRVAPADSVLGRLRPALAHLRRQDPHGGWGRYVGPDGIRWNRVVLAGHSQGGGESAYIAHEHAVAGALLFGSPIVTDGDVVATWLRTPGRTPASRIWAFDNTSDGFWPRIAASWRLLGLGTPHEVGPGRALGGHALVSTDRQAHAHLWVLDDSTPKDARGVPRYAPVWAWMLARCAPRSTSRTA